MTKIPVGLEEDGAGGSKVLNSTGNFTLDCSAVVCSALTFGIVLLEREYII